MVKTDEADDTKINVTFIIERTFKTKHLGLKLDPNQVESQLGYLISTWGHVN